MSIYSLIGSYMFRFRFIRSFYSFALDILFTKVISKLKMYACDSCSWLIGHAAAFFWHFLLVVGKKKTQIRCCSAALLQCIYTAIELIGSSREIKKIYLKFINTTHSASWIRDGSDNFNVEINITPPITPFKFWWFFSLLMILCECRRRRRRHCCRYYDQT